MKILIVGASGYLGNTIYKKLQECTGDDIYGTCYKSSNNDINNSINSNLKESSDIYEIRN